MSLTMLNIEDKAACSEAEGTLIARKILSEIMQFRRVVHSSESCRTPSCYFCSSPHLSKVVSTMEQKQPMTFVLPAFPGKSPNPSKVLGVLPDMAEVRALKFLNYLCNRIRRHYLHGAKIILCSDGRVFSDVVGMREADVTAYQRELDRLIEEYSLENISTFNLDEMCEDGDFVSERRKLMEQYGEPLESLREKIRQGGRQSDIPEYRDSHRMYCGITRFLVEDAMVPGQMKSRTSIQKDCRTRAYEVIRRSNAWTNLIADRFPEGIRLSIHPQACGSKKLGIRLLGDETWITPWHGVAVDTGKGFVLMKRSEAEKLPTRLMFDARGRASHYELATQ